MEVIDALFNNQPVLDLLRHQPVLTLFLMLGCGYLLGNIKFGSFSLGPVAGVLFVGLFLGHHGFDSSPGAQSVGFALFIFSVGYQAGPRFFDVLMTDGLRYFALSLVIAAAGLSVAMLLANAMDLDPGMSAGLLSGGMTSSPTLAAAQEALRAGSITPPAGWTTDQMIGNVATGYAITYIFGLAGLIAVIKLLPGMLGISLAEEAQKIERAADTDTIAPINVVARRYRVTEGLATRLPAAELRQKYWDGFAVGMLFRDGQRTHLEDDESARVGDEILLVGDLKFFSRDVQSMGEEIIDHDDQSDFEKAGVVVIESAAVGKSLRELRLSQRFGVVVGGIRRMRMMLPLTHDFQLRKGDILIVSGVPESIDELGREIGHVERDEEETDMITFSFGIAMGVLIGLVSVKIGGLSIGLGSAGGLLTAGLLIGFARSVRPTFGRLPDAARWVFMEFGLLLFMAGVGLRAGADIIEVFLEAGPTLVLAGIMVTLIPVAVGYVFGRKVLDLNPVILLGAITGAMTSGASLSVVTNEAKSAVPSLGYTGSYAFSNVLLTVAGSFILLF